METKLAPLKRVRMEWAQHDPDGYCRDIAEDVVDQLGGEFLQFYAKSSNISGYHSDYMDFANSPNINTPLYGDWQFGEYAYHTVAVVDDIVIDLFAQPYNVPIERCLFTLDQYCDMMESHNEEELVYYRSDGE